MQEQTYIYPPRTKLAVPRTQCEIYSQKGWIAQYKYNDTRTLIKLRTNGRIELWNRHAQRLIYNAPIPLQEQIQTLRETLPGYTLIDGGLLHNKHKAIKDTLVLWDIIILCNEYQTKPTYQERHQKLINMTTGPYYHNNIEIGRCITDNIIVPSNHTQFTQAWATVDRVNQPYEQPLIEGIVMKDPNSRLKRATKPINNNEWMVRSRVTTGRHNF